MNVNELSNKLAKLPQDVEVVVRGENTLGEISSVYIDNDHTDDTPFVSIDIVESSQPSVEADAEGCPDCGDTISPYKCQTCDGN